jgi:hypothetical protein
MEFFLSAMAFAGLIALQFAAVVAVHRARLDRLERPAAGRDGLHEDRPGIGIMMYGD